MKTVDWMSALADETRLRTFRVLAEGATDLCVAELADILCKPPYAVSRSLIELRKAGLVREDRRGKFVYYGVTDHPGIHSLGAWVLDHCQDCDDDVERNPDGTTRPGASRCHYDRERLAWRLSIREPDRLPITRPPSKPGEDSRPRVLFVCSHNSARSQLAEEYLRALAGDQFQVESAGLEPGSLNPEVVALLGEEGIDLSEKKTQSVAQLYRRGETYSWVIAVCSREAEADCPTFPGPVRRLWWPFPDPRDFVGTPQQIREQVRVLAVAIKKQVREFVSEVIQKEKS